jgi:hypothetical protein
MVASCASTNKRTGKPKPSAISTLLFLAAGETGAGSNTVNLWMNPGVHYVLAQQTSHWHGSLPLHAGQPTFMCSFVPAMGSAA